MSVKRVLMKYSYVAWELGSTFKALEGAIRDQKETARVDGAVLREREKYAPYRRV